MGKAWNPLPPIPGKSMASTVKVGDFIAVCFEKPFEWCIGSVVSVVGKKQKGFWVKWDDVKSKHIPEDELYLTENGLQGNWCIVTKRSK